MSFLLNSQSKNIATFHSNQGTNLYKFGLNKIFKPLDKKLHARIAVSKTAKNFINTYFENTYEIIPNGINVDFYKKSTLINKITDDKIIISGGSRGEYIPDTTSSNIEGQILYSSEIIQSSEVEQKSSTDPSEDNADGTLLQVSLTGSSRAERFLGSYDQIERLALDVFQGGELGELKEALDEWLKHILYHVDTEDVFLTGPLKEKTLPDGRLVVKDNVAEHDQIRL